MQYGIPLDIIEENVQNIFRTYPSLQQTDIIKRNLTKCVEVMIAYPNIINNTEIYNNELLSYSLFPKSTSSIIGLIMFFKRSCSSNELINAGKALDSNSKHKTNNCEQPAKIAQNLRDLGFRFYGKNEHQFSWSENGVTYRKILSFVESDIIIRRTINLAPNEKEIFFRYQEDLLFGPLLNKKCEIDHRTPESIFRHTSGDVVHLTMRSIMSGCAEEHYQVLGKQTNDIKREICISCQRGNDIIIPLSVRSLGGDEIYKKNRNTNNTCKGCFWYNHLKPENIQNIQIPSLLKQREIFYENYCRRMKDFIKLVEESPSKKYHYLYEEGLIQEQKRKLNSGVIDFLDNIL